jgi:two-component system, response regulator RegA
MPEECESPSLRILVADATYSATRLVDSLARMGISVASASSLRSARQLAIEFQPALIVSDWYFPDGCTLELIENVRCTMQEPPSVIVATAHGSIAAAHAAILAGARDYLTKPVTAAQILFAWCSDRGLQHGHDTWCTLEEAKRLYILEMLHEYVSVAQTARALGVDRRSLRRMMARHRVKATRSTSRLASGATDVADLERTYRASVGANGDRGREFPPRE